MGSQDKDIDEENARNTPGHAQRNHVAGQSDSLIETQHSVLPKRSRKKRTRRKISSEDVNEPEKGVRQCHREDPEVGAGNILRRDLEVLVSDQGIYESSFEYLDHTADVQLHAWGDSLKEAFEQVALCMFNYMTPLTGIVNELLKKRRSEDEDSSHVAVVEKEFVVSGNDVESLMFHWLDELLFTFSTDFFVPVVLDIVEFDVTAWRIRARGKGDVFDPARHACGTEIKAITYSAMKIYETSPVKAGKSEVYVIVDI